MIDPDETYPEGSVLYYLTLEGASVGKADVASGRYDRAHLPRKWGNFMKALSVFLPISSYSMLLDKSLYSKRTEKRKETTPTATFPTRKAAVRTATSVISMKCIRGLCTRPGRP